MNPPLAAEDRALSELGAWLAGSGYRFVTPTPATHRRVNARAEAAETTSLRGALGWSRRFRPGALADGGEVERLLAAAGVLRSEGALRRSSVRFSTVDAEVDAGRRDARPDVYVHSAYPTLASDAVFFGPDTYRYLALLRRTLEPTGRLVDVGAGSGAGGLALRDRAAEIVLADVNPVALRYARVNAAIAGTTARVRTVESDVLAGVDGRIDAVVANPPYLVDPEHRVYRDGGGALGFALSLRIVGEALARLSPGGQLVLYTGSPVVDGRHPLREALAPLLATRRGRYTWHELDPDVFGEELDTPAYRDAGVERLAVVALVARVE